jgi:hypothetical protein
MTDEGVLIMSRPFKTALVVLAVIGSLALSPGSALADGAGASPSTGGASGCCRTIVD